MPSEARGATAAAAAPAGGDTGVVAAPVWLELLPVAFAAALASVGLAGLALALLGAYSTPLALILGVPPAVAAVLLVRRCLGPLHGDRSNLPAALVALVLVLGFTVLAAAAPSQHVLVNRDPGSYTTTARWLVRDGSLEVQAAVGGLEPDPALTHASYAVYDTGGGDLQFQFNHLTSVALAVGYDLGGHRLMFRVPALVAAAGLLAVHALAVRITRRPWAALAAPALLGASMPLLYVARDTFSEPFTMLLLWSAALMGVVALRAQRAGAAAVAGAALGAAVATRSDSLLYIAVALPLLAAWVGAGPGELRARLRVAAAAMGATSVGVALGLVDLQQRTGGYVDRHGDQVALLQSSTLVSLLLSVVGAVLLVRNEGLTATARRWAARAALPGAAVTVGALLLGWLMRPSLHTMRGEDEVPLVAALQSAAGVPVEASRRYGEMSLEWMSWYLGPLGLLVAILGTGVAVHRLLKGRGSAPLAMVTSILLVAGAVYWWRPSIVPDQVWAMRRFVPAVLPALVLMVPVLLVAVAGWPRQRPTAARGVAAVLGVLIVVGVGAITWPVRELREQHGHLGVLLEACELIGDDASVVVVGEPSTDVLPQSVRSWCGVPVASLVAGAGPDDVERVRGAVHGRGRSIVWLSADGAALAPLTAQDGTVRTTGTAVEHRHPQRTLLRAPQGYEPPGSGWSLAVLREDP